jgi:hypothetical protein
MMSHVDLDPVECKLVGQSRTGSVFAAGAIDQWTRHLLENQTLLCRCDACVVFLFIYQSHDTGV